MSSSLAPDPTGFNALFAALDAAQTAAVQAQQDAAGANSSIGTTNAQLDAALVLLGELGWPVSVQIRDPYIISNVVVTLSPMSGTLANSSSSVTLTATVKNSVTGAILNFPVAWTSDNPAIVLTPSGTTCVVKGTAAGQVGHVTATAGTVSTTATITTAAQQITGLGLFPNQLNLTTTTLQTINVVGTDQFGASVVPTNVAWSNSESPSGCYTFTGFQLPSPHATVQAVSSGSGTIQATANGINATCAVTVNLSTGTGASPGNNYPGNMTIVVNTGSMTATPATLGQNGGGSGFVWSVTGPTGIVTQFTNESPQTVSGTGEWSGNITIGTNGHGLRVLYPNNLAGGNSPARWRIGWNQNGTGFLYVAFVFRLSQGWNFSQASGIKMLEPLSVVSGNNDYFGWNCQNAQGNKDGVSAYPFFGIQGNHTNDLPGAPQGFPAPPNVYAGAFANIGGTGPNQHVVEFYIQPESPSNSGTNGQLTFWIDQQLAWTSVGKAAGGGTGVPTAGITFDAGGYTGINCDPTYGGDVATDHPPANAQPMYWEVDQIFVAVA